MDYLLFLVCIEQANALTSSLYHLQFWEFHSGSCWEVEHTDFDSVNTSCHSAICAIPQNSHVVPFMVIDIILVESLLHGDSTEWDPNLLVVHGYDFLFVRLNGTVTENKVLTESMYDLQRRLANDIYLFHHICNCFFPKVQSLLETKCDTDKASRSNSPHAEESKEGSFSSSISVLHPETKREGQFIKEEGIGTSGHASAGVGVKTQIKICVNTWNKGGKKHTYNAK